MTAPTLVGEGNIATATNTSNLSVTIPAHEVDDIIVIVTANWVPNTTSGTNQTSMTSPWTKLTALTQTSGSPIDSELSIYWTRATSTSTTGSIVRGSGWDSGTDGLRAARAYVIRGCTPTGDPWDAAVVATLQSAANLTMPAVTVSGSERLVIQFLIANDDNGVGTTPSGWTAGTRATSTTGTDAEFQTFRKDNQSSSSAAQASAVAARTAGFYTFVGISFKPPAAVAPSSITDLSVTAGDAQVTLNWTAPSNGGSAITGYDYRVDGGSWISTGSTATSKVVTGLTNGVEYDFEVRAVNAIGAALTSNVATATPLAPADNFGAVGSSLSSKLYVGINLVSKLYLGATQLWPSVPTGPSITHDFIGVYNGSGNQTISIPADANVGDVIYAVGATQDSTAFTSVPPSGWVSLGATTDTDRMQVWRKVLVSGDPGSTVVFPLDPVWYSSAMTAVVVTGVNIITPENVLGTVANGSSGTAITAAGPTTTVDNTLLLVFGGSSEDGGTGVFSVTSGGYTTVLTTQHSYATTWIGSKTQPSAGAASDAVLGFNSAWAGSLGLGAMIVAVNPA